ncbi:MAG: restriction endonuclease subunit S [Clostridia bacterium]
MSEYNNIPKIRFKGFTDVWEQRKLGDVARFKQGTQVDLEKQYSEKNNDRVRFIRIVDYTQNTDDIRYIDKSNSNELINDDDIVIVRYGATAGFVGHGIIGVLANNMFTVNPEKELNKNYLYTYLKQEKIYKLLNNSNGSSAMPALNFGTVKDVEITYPKTNEQKDISKLFSNIDNLITLHQRKCDKLTNIKKSMLEKMFPKNSSNIPEIRFKGFTDVWEQRKLKDITSIITKGTTPLDKSGNGDINFVKIENINPSTGIIESTSKITEEEHNGYLRRSQLKENDLLFSIAGTLGRVSLVNKGILPANTNQALAIIRLKECDLNYIKTFLKGKAISDFIKKNPTIGAQPNLSLEQVSNFEISYPEDTEAHKIGILLDNLDNLITLHQRKVEKLNNIKKSMLEKMFV